MKIEGPLINQAQCPTNESTLAPARGMEGAKISPTCLTYVLNPKTLTLAELNQRFWPHSQI